MLPSAMIRRFDLCGRSAPDDLQRTPVIEPVDPFQGCEFHRHLASPGGHHARNKRVPAAARWKRAAPTSWNGLPRATETFAASQETGGIK